IDDGQNNTPVADPVFVETVPLRSQVLGLQETRIFSPTVLNVATFGFTRARGATGNAPATAFPANLSFVAGVTPGTLSIGGGINSPGQGSITQANGTKAVYSAKNNFTWADDIHLIKGSHSLSA